MRSVSPPPRWLPQQLLWFVEIAIFLAIEQFFSFSPALQSKCQKDREEMFYLARREQDAHTHETNDDRCNKFEWTCIKLMLLITMTRSSSRSMHSSRMLGWSQTGKTHPTINDRRTRDFSLLRAYLRSDLCLSCEFCGRESYLCKEHNERERLRCMRHRNEHIEANKFLGQIIMQLNLSSMCARERLGWLRKIIWTWAWTRLELIWINLQIKIPIVGWNSSRWDREQRDEHERKHSVFFLFQHQQSALQLCSIALAELEFASLRWSRRDWELKIFFLWENKISP